jgi:hypothetical protein
MIDVMRTTTLEQTDKCCYSNFGIETTT